MKTLGEAGLVIAVCTQLVLWTKAESNTTETQLLMLNMYDINADGKLESIEIKIALISKHNVAPVNVEGLKEKYIKLKRPITEDDLNLTSIEAHQADILFEDFKRKYGIRTASSNYYNPALIDAEDLGVKAPPFKARLNEEYVLNAPKIKIRRTDDQLKYADLEDAQSALFSYAHNFDTSGNSFNLQGAIAVDIPIIESPSEVELKRQNAQDDLFSPSFELRSVDFLLGSSFNLISGDVPAEKKVDSLIGRFGTQAVVANHNGMGEILDGEIVVTNFTFTTDFEGRQKLVGGEFNLTPLRYNIGLGAFHGVGPAVTSDGNPMFKALLNLVVHLEAGSILDPGRNESLLGSSAYVRLGPLIGLKIVPIKLPDLSFSIQYNFYKELDDSSNVDNELFLASAEWNVGGNNHYSLKLEYQQGRTPIVNQRVNSLTAGFGVKY